MEKLIITAAICGAEVTKEQNPAVPYTIEELVNEAYLSYLMGASIIHLHVRRDDGTPTQDSNRFKLAHEAIQKACPGVIIQFSTGGAVGMTIEERLDATKLCPEMATLDCGSVNFGGDEVFINTENDIIHVAKTLQERSIKPECEVFEKGHLDSLLRLHKKGLIQGPLHIGLVLGVNGGMSGELRDFHFMRESIPSNATWSVAGIGKYEFPLAEAAIIHGGHVRVGLEDNLFIEKGVLAKSNAELVAKVVKMARSYGRSIATPEEARQILRIKE
ncbi:MAG TPA: 3-keto-5-aminohexanoate cleavage protein [Bacilli bacterium]|nr:3-keto-5-aminohexanoate cleavage protein [Bacilli bacterium]